MLCFKSSEIIQALLDADWDVELKSQQLIVSIVNKYYYYYYYYYYY